MALSPDDNLEPLAALAQAAARAEAARLQRLSACGPEPARGEVYVLPLPVPGPEQWLVLANEPERGVQLAPVDSAPLPGTGEVWLPTPVGPRCVRTLAAMWLPTAALATAERSDVWPLGPLPEQAAPDSSAGAAPSADPAARAWLASARRAARWLPAWLLDQTLALDLSEWNDLSDPADPVVEGGRVSAPIVPLRVRQPALAAAGPQAAARFAQVAESLRHGSRRLRLDCRGGILELGASLHAVGLRYVPDHEAMPPTVRQLAPGAEVDLPWLQRGDGSQVLSVRHDWRQPWRVVVDLPPPFVLQVAWSEVGS